MKILAVNAGRTNGNGEILAKATLMRAEELGAEVKMINLHDYNIKPCSGCESCRGAKDHFFEIQDTMKKYFNNMSVIKDKVKKYTEYKPATIVK